MHFIEYDKFTYLFTQNRLEWESSEINKRLLNSLKKAGYKNKSKNNSLAGNNVLENLKGKASRKMLFQRAFVKKRQREQLGGKLNEEKELRERNRGRRTTNMLLAMVRPHMKPILSTFKEACANIVIDYAI